MGKKSEIKVTTSDGRIDRLRYAGWTIGVSLTIVGFAVVAAAAESTYSDFAELAMFAFWAVLLIGALISIFLHVQRFHDVNVSGSAVLLLLVPVLNLAVFLYLLFAPGTKGPNLYGPDPLGRESKAATPPESSAQSNTPIQPVPDRLRELKRLHEQGLVSDTAYQRREAEILADL